MSFMIELPAELEAELNAEAARQGLALSDYVVRMLARVRNGNSPSPRSGAEVLAYWQSEGLIGTRSDITDSAAHAREIREQAQRRMRS